MAMWYVVPATVAKLTLLPPPKPATSSFEATGVSAFTAAPVYTPRRVSKSPPARKATCGMLPSPGAVHEYQIDFPPTWPAWVGSPASTPALTLLARTKPSVSAIAFRLTASAKSSLGGAIAADMADGTASRNRAATSGTRRTGDLLGDSRDRKAWGGRRQPAGLLARRGARLR